ncbi:hypothetical protein [Marinobacter zhejiangensis]|uniref:Uncharacterized protein n=1 Tax=Marinobacter zhejiangensis TaxID=488535 RepID=A0A1I4RNR4_9GAMM|nr:hypothetical protein [Marinobacter zhejiangensis]SFM53630.1 hypothetical protein SAMN04487963_2855 [Marinobacter zhejiangensis]
MSSMTLYSAAIQANEGFDSPVPVEGLPGWTVFKQQQTEIYVITHNLNLSNPGLEMQVVATSMSPQVRVVVQHVDPNSFTVSSWHDNSIPAQTDFMFIATHKNAPTPPTKLTSSSSS